MDRAISAEGSQQCECRRKKLSELSNTHLTGRHRKFAMLIPSEARYVTLYRYVVGRIGEYQLGFLSTQQLNVAVGFQGVTTEQIMVPDTPAIAWPRDSGNSTIDCR